MAKRFVDNLRAARSPPCFGNRAAPPPWLGPLNGGLPAGEHSKYKGLRTGGNVPQPHDSALDIIGDSQIAKRSPVRADQAKVTFRARDCGFIGGLRIANTGDPLGPFEVGPIMRSQARSYP